MDSLARNKWHERTEITTCKCFEGIKNNPEGQEFRAHLPQSVRPPLAVCIGLCLVHTDKGELGPPEDQLCECMRARSRNVNLGKGPLMLWCTRLWDGIPRRFHSLGLLKLD